MLRPKVLIKVYGVERIQYVIWQCAGPFCCQTADGHLACLALGEVSFPHIIHDICTFRPKWRFY